MIFTLYLLLRINIPKSNLLYIIIVIVLFLCILFILKLLVIVVSLSLLQYLLWEYHFLLEILLLLRWSMVFAGFLFLEILAIFVSYIFLELLLAFEILNTLHLFLCIQLRNYDLVSFFRSVILRWLITYLYMWSLKGAVNGSFIYIIVLFLFSTFFLWMVDLTIILLYLILVNIVLVLYRFLNTMILYWICDMWLLPFLSDEFFTDGALRLLR